MKAIYYFVNKIFKKEEAPVPVIFNTKKNKTYNVLQRSYILFIQSGFKRGLEKICA